MVYDTYLLQISVTAKEKSFIRGSLHNLGIVALVIR